jgi:hypothetical protein
MHTCSRSIKSHGIENCNNGNDNNDKCNDCNNNCNSTTFVLSSRRVLNYLPRTTNVSRVFLDLSFLSSQDIVHFVSIAASPPHNIRHVVVGLRGDPNTDPNNSTNDHCTKKLMEFLHELHRQKLHHLETLRIQKTMPHDSTILLPCLRKVLLTNVHLTTLDVAFDTMDLTVTSFLVDVLSQGLPLLQTLRLMFLSQTDELDHDTNSLTWRHCFQRSAAVCRQIDSIHVTGYSAFSFLSEMFPNLSCSTMSCDDFSRTSPTYPRVVTFHRCIQLHLTLRWTNVSLLANAIRTIVHTLTLDVRHVRALDHDIANSVIRLLSRTFPNLRNLTLRQRSMTKSQFLQFCALFHHQHRYPNLASLTLNICKLHFDECRMAYLQIIQKCPTIVNTSASFLDDATNREAQYLCIANKIQLPQLLRLHHDDDGHCDSVYNDSDDNDDNNRASDSAKSIPLGLWSHMLSALHPHPSILYTLLKEKSPELIQQQHRNDDDRVPSRTTNCC